MDKSISSVWKKRMTVPDPYAVRLQKEKVRHCLVVCMQSSSAEMDLLLVMWNRVSSQT